MGMERSVKRLMEDREKRREENIKKYIEQLEHESTPYPLTGLPKPWGGCADPRAVEPLIAALHDPENEVRWVAAQALGKLHDARGVDPPPPPPSPIRTAGCDAAPPGRLVRSETPARSNRSSPSLRTGRRTSGVAAADALGKLHDARSAGALSGALESEEEPEVRTAIRRALREITGEIGF